VEIVDGILDRARAAGATDVHIQPTASVLDVRWRVDGVLLPVETLPKALAPNVVARLKVLAGLLTYRTDVPQEGRIQGVAGDVEMRLSTFPTLYGEKAVIRLFAETHRYQQVADLGFPDEVCNRLLELLNETSGAIIIAGPAGSGKTTTVYACLREIVRWSSGGRSLATIEDPIEVAVDGVSQSQVNPVAGFDLATGLRSLLRQDPEVLAVGEIRDRATAYGAFQASLTGHLVLTTFHAGSAAAAVGRLTDMGIEPYLLRSGLLAVICQRLVRRLCTCARRSDAAHERLGLPVQEFWLPVGCPACAGTGYTGRFVLAEILDPAHPRVAQGILDRVDVDQLEARATGEGMVSRWQRAAAAVELGLTSPAEIRRVLGFSKSPVE
jgi:type II secretory ATPase GspE/PulE/Tfp pilus assembly ATPase PilB-like protein